MVTEEVELVGGAEVEAFLGGDLGGVVAGWEEGGALGKRGVASGSKTLVAAQALVVDAGLDKGQFEGCCLGADRVRIRGRRLGGVDEVEEVWIDKEGLGIDGIPKGERRAGGG